MCSTWAQLWDQMQICFLYGILIRFKLSSNTNQSNNIALPLRLMPLGDSITDGEFSLDGNGYRYALRQMLLMDGYLVEMVGSRNSGLMENNDNEGWRGFRIDEIISKAEDSVPLFMPNVFTVNAGTNDVLQYFDLDNIAIRMNALLEYLWTASPGSTIIFSTLTVNADEEVDSLILRVNEQFRGLAQAKLADKKRLVFVDMHGTDGPQPCESPDGTHPNDIGYIKMAQIWHIGIREAISQGFLQKPLVHDKSG